jgi:[protein-PII] uridylyltransferase
MFLYPSGVKPEVLKPFQEYLTRSSSTCSGLRLKGRPLQPHREEAFVEARKDIQTKTALLESRLLAGSPQVFENFQAAYRNYYRTRTPAPTSPSGSRTRPSAVSKNRRYRLPPGAQHQERRRRPARLPDTLWMARVKLGLQHIEELKEQNYLREEELRDFQRGYDFLLRVRNELHYTANHATDLLNLDNQPRVALGLGYTAESPVERVEAFMQEYYRQAQAIYRVSKLVEDRLALTLAEAPSRFSLRALIRYRRTERPKSIDGFILRGNRLSAEKSSVFLDDPERPRARLPPLPAARCTPDLDLQSLIRSSAPLCNEAVRNAPGAVDSFKAIMQEAGNVYPTLSLMHELGILGRFVPEFEQLNCLVQLEFYHRYTAESTLSTPSPSSTPSTRARRHRRGTPRGLHQSETPPFSISAPPPRYRKAPAHGHAESGVHLAPPSSPASQRPRDAELVSFIIPTISRWHASQSTPGRSSDYRAHRRDDGDIEKLRFLYVSHLLRSPRDLRRILWNSYKNTLSRRPIPSTAERLTLATPPRSTQRRTQSHAPPHLIAQKSPASAPPRSTPFNLLP